MNMSRASLTGLTSPLLESFEEFYYELLRQKEKALRLGDRFQSTTPDPALDETEAQEPQSEILSQDVINLTRSIQKRLRLVIEEQQVAADMHTSTGFQTANLRDAHYVMAALSDEIFLNLDWAGVETWKTAMLEAQLFGVQISGEQFFLKLDTLLTSNGPQRAELGMIYLLALSFGFRGQYRGQDDQKKIKWYMEQLYALTNDGEQGILSGSEDARLIASCYSATLTDPPARGLPDVKTWAIWISAVLFVYVLITYIVWYQLSAEIHESVQAIVAQSGKQTTP